MNDATARARVLAFGKRFAYPIPDALLALLYASAAVVDFLPPSIFERIPMGIVDVRDELGFALMIEGGFLMAQGTLVDIATRLKKRPPIWAIPLILGAVLLFSNEARAILQMAWSRGSAVFVPLLFSLLERGFVLWNMPTRSRPEKIAARALVANRITTALILLALLTATMLAGRTEPWLFLAAGAIYFAVATFDDWRVRGAKFAARPSVLFRFDPIHIEYLEPL